MIFAKTWRQVLDGTKCHTLRLQYAGDRLGDWHRPGWSRSRAVYDRDGRPRWVMGHTYAVQPGRCHFARGRIRIAELHEVLDPEEFLVWRFRDEGFETGEEALATWRKLHPRNPIQPCWGIRFELVRSE